MAKMKDIDSKLVTLQTKIMIPYTRYGKKSIDRSTLVIKIDKETFIDLYLFILLLFESFV